MLKSAPGDLQNTFKVLGEANILESDFADKIAPVVGLRNRVVHRYDSPSKQKFIENLKTNFSDFEKYLEIIVDLVKKS